jgi:hypothetical protein
VPNPRYEHVDLEAARSTILRDHPRARMAGGATSSGVPIVLVVTILRAKTGAKLRKE